MDPTTFHSNTNGKKKGRSLWQRRARHKKVVMEATTVNTFATTCSHPKNESDKNGAPSLQRSLDDHLETAYQTTPFSFHYWSLFFSLGVANSSDASEILCLSYMVSDAQFESTMLAGHAWKASLLTSTVFCGMLLGGLIVGCLGDRAGRRPMLLMGLTINAVFGILSACAPDAVTLSVIRLVAGVGIGATVPPLFALCSELATISSRGLFVTVAASFWMVGSLFVAIVGWLLLENGYSWRIFAMVCAIPSCLGAVLVYCVVPESPRFLLMNQQYDAALRVVDQLVTAMGWVGPSWTMQEARHFFPPKDEEAHHWNNNTLYSFRQLNWRRAVAAFLQSTSTLYKGNTRKVTWPLQVVWFSLSFGSYGLLTWINTLFVEVHLENVYFNALLFAVSNLPGNLLSAYLMDRMGRTKLLSSSIVAAAGCLVTFAYWAAQDDGGTKAFWIVTSACGFQCFTIASWNSIDVLTSELFPTAVRSTGMGVCAATGRVGAMVAQGVNGYLVGSPAKLLLTAATTLLVGALTPMLYLHEITGQPVADYAMTQQEGSHYEQIALTYVD